MLIQKLVVAGVHNQKSWDHDWVVTGFYTLIEFLRQLGKFLESSGKQGHISLVFLLGLSKTKSKFIYIFTHIGSFLSPYGNSECQCVPNYVLISPLCKIQTLFYGPQFAWFYLCSSRGLVKVDQRIERWVTGLYLSLPKSLFLSNWLRSNPC